MTMYGMCVLCASVERDAVLLPQSLGASLEASKLLAERDAAAAQLVEARSIATAAQQDAARQANFVGGQSCLLQHQQQQLGMSLPWAEQSAYVQ